MFRSFRALIGEEIAQVALAGADAEQAELLDRILEDGAQRVLVAHVDGELAGFVSFSVDAERGIGEIGLNAVDPAHAGRGIGTLLYERALEAMRERGARMATVSTGGDESHAAARRAYAKAGFGPSIPSVTLYRTL